MSRRFVAISDLHAHPWAAFGRGDGSNNTRLQRTLGVLDQSLQKARVLGVPWVMAGDIVHTAGYTLNVVLAELINVLRRFPDVEKLAVWGQHDSRGQGGLITLNQTVWAALVTAVPNLTMLTPDLAPVIRGGLTFTGAGFQPNGQQQYGQPSDVGVYHGTVRGSTVPSGFILDNGIEPVELTKRHNVTVVGDIHHPQQIGGSILIPGAPEHHNFGDFGERGFWVVTLPAIDEQAGVVVEFVPSGSPQFLTVESARAVKSDGNFYRVTSAQKGDRLPENATAISPEPTVVQSRAAMRGATGDQVLQAWLREDPPSGDANEYLNLGRGLLGEQESTALRSVRLIQLHLTNFCSYVEQTFSIQPGTWLVVGKGRDFPSNGAGKSTLFEAVFWTLFGRTTKGLTGDEVIRWGADACDVTATFLIETTNRQLTVTRSRGSASRLDVAETDGRQVTRWEATSVNEMTEKLTKYLGLTPELYQALGYFSQERLLLFASATDGERKEMLADLIGLSQYQAAASAAQKRLTNLELGASTQSAFVQSAEAQLEAERQRLEAACVRSAAWETDRQSRTQAADLEYEQFVSDVPATQKALMAEALKSLGGSLDQREQQRSDTKRQAEAWLAVERPISTPEALRATKSQYDVVWAQSTSLRDAADEIDKRIDDARSKLARADHVLSQGLCPSCGQAVSAEHKSACLAPHEADVAALEARANEIAQQQTAAADLIASLGDQVGQCERGVSNYRERESWTNVLSTVEADLAQLAEERIQLTTTAAHHVDKILGEKRAALAVATTRIRSEKNPWVIEEQATRERIVAHETTIKAHSQELERIAAEQVVCAYWQRGFSKQGIQSLLVNEIAAVFNAARGLILPALTQGVYDVQFSTTSQTKGGERRERTEFVVYERGQPVPYAALSGGQRRRIDVGVMLTLVKSVSEWLQVPGVLGVLVLDEVFGFLDQSGAEGLMDALREVQATVPSIYAVSHDQQLQALFSGVLSIEQDASGVSRIVEGA